MLIALPVLQFVVFWFYVNCSSFTLAFKNKVSGEWALDNFKEIWTMMTNPQEKGMSLLDMLGRSFALWFVSNVIVFPISLCTTYVLFRRVSGHYFFRVIYMLPSLLGGVVWVATMKQVLSNHGAVVYILKQLKIPLSTAVQNDGLLFDPKTAFLTLCFTVILFGIAGGNAVITGAYSRIPTELFEVGKLDGISFWREFFVICLPCIWPTVSTLLTFSLCGIFSGEGNVFLYTNGTGRPQMATIGFYLQRLVVDLEGSSAVWENPYGIPSGIGMLLTLATLPVALIGRVVLEKLVEAVET